MERRARLFLLAALLVALACGCHAPRPPANANASQKAPLGDEVAAGEAQGPQEGATPSEHEDDEPDLSPTETAEVDEAVPAPDPAAGRATPAVAVRYAGLDKTSCENELTRRQIAWTPVTDARGVSAPLRLAGPLSGVTFRSNLPESKSRTSPYDIYDCRLVLALDDFARVLARHGIVEVVHLSVYRPVSSKVVLKGPGRRHSGALAIDAAIFKTRDGRTLSVEKDFHPRRIGARPCPAPESASELRKIACEAADARFFNVLLTPDFNWAHRNHFHLEVTANVSWTLVR